MTVANSLVSKLFIKLEHQAEMSEAIALDVRRSVGIVGDINSSEISPRQVLVVCQTDLQQLSIAPGELRENIVLNLADTDLFKPGAKLIFASGAEIRLTFYCEPCKRMAHLVDSIKNLKQKRGILGVVVNSGAIAVNDEIAIEPNCFPALSETPYERFLNYVKLIPVGKVVTYQQIIQCIGVDKSYFRAIPMYLKKAPADYPVHRIVDSQGKITPHVPLQREKLIAEGIQVIEGISSQNVCLEKYAWKHKSIY